MNKAKKIMMIAACAVLLVCISVGATIAYLTDTEAVTNTFSVGQVGLSLDEAITNIEGKPLKNNLVVDSLAQADRTNAVRSGNDYKLIPNMSYTKDPTITVDSRSEKCFVVAKINLTGADELSTLLAYEGSNGLIGFEGFVTGGVFDGTKYTVETEGAGITMKGKHAVYGDITMTQTKNSDGSFTFYIYFEDEKAANDKLVLFDTLKVPAAWSNTDIAGLEDMEMTISAYAVQAAGFDDVFKAFKAGEDSNWKN